METDMSLSQVLGDIKNDSSWWGLRLKDAVANGLSWDAKCYAIHWEAYSCIRKL
uniref:Uncharacterized protein n=1 Tax=Aegilops tauschii subsp. strangulata TaxID=200361 RepID=A0A453PZD6_AEGTS